MKITMLTSALLVFSLGASAQIIGTVPAAKVKNSACSNGQVPTYDANKRLTGCAGSAGAATLTKTWFPYGSTNLSSSNKHTPDVGVANRVQFYSLTIPTARLITSLRAILQNGIGHTAWGIYNSACNLVAASVTRPPIITNAHIIWTFPNVTVPAGDYYLAFTSTHTGDKIFAVHEDYVGYIANVGLSSPNLAYFFGNSASGSTTLTFPATCGVQTAMVDAGWGRPAVALN